MSKRTNIWVCLGSFCPTCMVPVGKKCKSLRKSLTGEARRPHPARVLKWEREKPKRICGRCGRGIVRHDKWRFGDDGRCEHKCCESPQYESQEQREKIINRAMPLFERIA